MWLAVLFLCTSSSCDFVMSEPLETQAQCSQILVSVYAKLETAKEITAYQGKCFQIKQA
jgi:hypothetical protein